MAVHLSDTDTIIVALERLMKEEDDRLLLGMRGGAMTPETYRFTAGFLAGFDWVREQIADIRKHEEH